jgi:hypothetical protein
MLHWSQGALPHQTYWSQLLPALQLSALFGRCVVHSHRQSMSLSSNGLLTAAPMPDWLNKRMIKQENLSLDKS